MSRWTKYSPLRRSRVPRRKRTIPAAGEGDDRGRYFRCWNCGFPAVDIQKHELGDSNGVSVQEYVPMSYDTVMTMSDDIDEVVINNPASAKTYPIMAVVTGGCPACGIKNWK